MPVITQIATASWSGARAVWTAAALIVVFALIARWLRGVSLSGAVAGAIVCSLLYAGGGLGMFLTLVTVFALTWIATRVGYQRKLRLGIAETPQGRKASQVLANLSVAAVSSLLYSWPPGKTMFLVAAAAALSEAAADTVSSELGQASSDRAWLITTWEQVRAGTDGAVSWFGTLAGLAAAIAVSLVCVLTQTLPRRWLGISIFAAFAGTLADSLLGATLQRRRTLNNDAVNLLSTLVAAGIAAVAVSI